MWKRAAHLAIGIGMLSLSTYFLLGVAFGWKAFWKQEMWRAAHPVKSKPAIDDPLAGVADGKVYGVMSPEESSDSGDDNPPPHVSASPLEHVAPTVIAANHFLHKRIAVHDYQGIAFVVPPLALHPQLQGRFRSVGIGENAGGAVVELLLMTDRDFATFVRNQTQTTESSAVPSDHGAIDWKLNATYGKPQKYYLVFLNTLEGPGPITVDADFSVIFQ